ncbi:MAG: hypothetical protein A2622_09295 [Bdellovibrionales bacterium RIFCSPHIGHO2_01_FULL_40_29]|nr:MAG: hypothetical protein A2622_09295 [Bdellovibrionales bacterium RIFCSPHIGHO2_01_FULL_40_29]OFZ33581.1 MAG: hypothetical protein A3D17_00330 [Bdellovibrionales bacterium RIFCSPHIGHO2_02_FULL_40_15]
MKSGKRQDIISEQEFNKRVRNFSQMPRRDSPGDSEVDTRAEYLLGVNFDPEETEESNRDESGEKIYADDRSTAPSEVPSDINQADDDPEARVPSSAQVVSAQKPSPRGDFDKRSDTN